MKNAIYNHWGPKEILEWKMGQNFLPFSFDWNLVLMIVIANSLEILSGVHKFL
jgi:hypothetical protein